ncbi:SRPBCC family protein [Yinghuangia seranimata]|uniref:SRPBCC family protein n=1 Tax=Yinghuangia seranimata TaxID=408067 RepID=UPI00248B6BF9|nr:SRPBCC family protein [Yinghuangia seranimata]MDI2130257.1 SRPBCC family protein [Yinghuangia seranimata]
MKYTLRAEPIEFVQTAPRRRAWSADLAASPKQVFAALTDEPATWTGWFPNFKGGRFLSEAPEGAQPYGVGARREIRLVKPVVFHETIMAWEEPSRWAYRVDSATVPMFKALIEEWTIEERGTGSRVTWTFAVDPKAVIALTLRFAPFLISSTFYRAMRNLDRKLAPIAA